MVTCAFALIGRSEIANAALISRSFILLFPLDADTNCTRGVKASLTPPPFPPVSSLARPLPPGSRRGGPGFASGRSRRSARASIAQAVAGAEARAPRPAPLARSGRDAMEAADFERSAQDNEGVGLRPLPIGIVVGDTSSAWRGRVANRTRWPTFARRAAERLVKVTDLPQLPGYVAHVEGGESNMDVASLAAWWAAGVAISTIAAFLIFAVIGVWRRRHYWQRG